MNWETTIPLIAMFLVWTEIRTRNFERRLRRVEMEEERPPAGSPGAEKSQAPVPLSVEPRIIERDWW